MMANWFGKVNITNMKKIKVLFIRYETVKLETFFCANQNILNLIGSPWIDHGSLELSHKPGKHIWQPHCGGFCSGGHDLGP